MAHDHAAESETGHAGHSDKKIALLISVLTLFLAFSETLGTATQTSALSYNVEASDLWAFYQAKTIRIVTLRTAADALALDAAATADPAAKAAMQKRIDAWLKDAARYESEPPTKEGAKELEVRAEEAEHKRDTSLARYHHYEVASAALSIGIVLAAATVITGMIVLTYIAGALGIIGLAFMAIGLFAPHAVHLF
jgi:hypothetical protein